MILLKNKECEYLYICINRNKYIVPIANVELNSSFIRFSDLYYIEEQILEPFYSYVESLRIPFL